MNSGINGIGARRRKADVPSDSHLDQVKPAGSIQEIISDRPGRFVRQGTVLIFGLFLTLIASMWFVRFPDKLEGSATITTEPLPLRIKSGSSGRIVRLFVADGSFLAAGQMIAQTEHAMGFEQVKTLDELARGMEEALLADNIGSLRALASVSIGSLGEAQADFNSLTNAIGAYVLFRSQDIYASRGASMQAQHRSYQTLASLSNSEKSLIDDGLAQAEDRYDANERLYLDKVISRQEYYEEAARLRAKQLELQQQRRASLLNSLSLASSGQQLRDMRYEQEALRSGQLAAIRDQIRSLRNSIREWRLRHLIVAPISGRLHFLQPLQVGERLTEGAELCAMIPEDHKYTAVVELPARGAGKLRKGLEVQLMPEHFPPGEYGYLIGHVRDISAIPQTGPEGASYRVRVALPDTLVTSYKKSLPFSPEMSARAAIITEERNLLQRLFGGLAGLSY